MNEKSILLTLNFRLSEEAAINLPLEAEKFGLTNEEMASAILDDVLTGNWLENPDERGEFLLAKVGTLYPERWATLKAACESHRAALETVDAAAKVRFEKHFAGQISLTLPPAMVTFMRETGRHFPELWDIFVQECVEAVFDNIQHYLDNAYSFESPQDRQGAFRLIQEARETYLQAISEQQRTAR